MARGSLERLTTIWKANFNHLLDRMEDPEKMVRQFVRDMEDEVDKAARAAASALPTPSASVLYARCCFILLAPISRESPS